MTGNLLEKEIRKNGWSFEQAAVQLGVSRMTLYNLRRGNAPREAFEMIADKLFLDETKKEIFLIQNLYIPVTQVKNAYLYPDMILKAIKATSF